MGVYRVEVSPNNRAGCQVKACKDDAIKIKKGELRFAVQVTIKEHVSWQYRHWGCVTPKQIENLNETCEGDTDMIDGYDELPEEFQEKIKFAIEHNHIPDEDCTREPELNRLGVKKPRAKKANKDEGDDASEDEKPKKKGTKKAVKEEDEEEKPAPAPKKRSSKAKVKTEDEDEAVPAPKKRGRPSKKQVEQDDGEEESASPAKKARASGKNKKNSEPTNESEEEAPPPKKARGRKQAAKQAEPEDGSEIDEEVSKPKTVPQKRGRKKASN